jgi:hypothetical protein
LGIVFEDKISRTSVFNLKEIASVVALLRNDVGVARHCEETIAAGAVIVDAAILGIVFEDQISRTSFFI